MTLSTYGILKGTVVGHLRDADDDHYQILIRTGKTLHRIAANVRSSAPNAPATVLFLTTTTLPQTFTGGLQALAPGYKKLPSKPGGVALDYLRSGIVKTKSMKPLPPDEPGVDNDLKDTLQAAVVRAMELDGSVIYALGAKWGPEKKKGGPILQVHPGKRHPRHPHEPGQLGQIQEGQRHLPGWRVDHRVSPEQVACVLHCLPVAIVQD